MGARGDIDIASREVMASRNITSVDNSVMPDYNLLRQFPSTRRYHGPAVRVAHLGKAAHKKLHRCRLADFSLHLHQSLTRLLPYAPHPNGASTRSVQAGGPPEG